MSEWVNKKYGKSEWAGSKKYAGKKVSGKYEKGYVKAEIRKAYYARKEEASEIDRRIDESVKANSYWKKQAYTWWMGEISKEVGRKWVSGEDDKKVEEKYKEGLVIRAKDNYMDWIRLTTHGLIETRFHLYLAMLVDMCMKNAEMGKDQRITISCPPRAGKSTMIARRMASYWLGRHPDVEVMCLSADAELASDFGDNNRAVALEWWEKVFGISVSKAFKSKGAIGVEGTDGIMRFRGVSSTNVGKGGNLIIVDDPYPDEEFVNNPTQRKRLLSTLQNDIFSRSERQKKGDKELGSIILVIHTRRHEEDLIGILDHIYVKADESENGLSYKRWLNITIPAVATSANDVLGRKIGEALMPERGFEWSLKGLTLKKAEVGTRAWNSQFQQNPMAEGGNIIKKDWLKTYKSRDLPVYYDDIVLSCDLSNNSNANSDYSAFQVWARCGTEHYMLDRGKAKRTFNGQIEIIRQFIDKWIAKGHAIRRVLVEKRATGTAAIDLLGAELKGVAVIGFEVGYTDKATRVNTISNFFEGGHVWLPDESIDSGIEDYKNTLILFPNVGHDDEVDATSQYLIYCIKQVSGRIVSESSGFLEKLAKAIRS